MHDVYIVGRLVDDTDKRRITWQLLGVFTEVEKAEAACETIDDFVRPVNLNCRVAPVGTKPCQIWFPRVED